MQIPIKKKMLPAFYPNLTPNTLLVNQMRHLLMNTQALNLVFFDLLYSTAFLNISKREKGTFGKLLSLFWQLFLSSFFEIAAEGVDTREEL